MAFFRIEASFRSSFSYNPGQPGWDTRMPLTAQSPRDLTRSMLAVLCIAALILSSVWIMLPFLSATLWASTIVISTWPFLLWLQAKLGQKRGLATTVMVLVLLLVVLLPLTLSFGALFANADDIVARLKGFTIPPPPDWVARIPVEGAQIAEKWQRLSTEGPGSFSAELKPYVGRAVEWIAARIGGFGSMMLQFLLTVIIAGVLYAKGEVAAHGVRKFAVRLAGARGDRAVLLAAGTVQGVAKGIVVTALIQTAIGGAGLFLTSAPAAGLITAAAFIFCIAQLGPILVMLPVVIWKFYSGASVSGFVLLAFMLVAGTIDNFIRPILIRKGADLPILLIIAGVIGGIIGFGVMGLFVGPVLLAVSYVLLREWVESPPEEQASAATSA
jgi:predicted PurR-regulated permease PerM